MITISKTKNPDLVTSFLKKEGIRRLCSGGANSTIDDEAAKEVIKSDDNHIFMVYDSGACVGWVAFFLIAKDRYTIHLCLHTRGEKTKQAIKLCLDCMKIVEKAEKIYAVYLYERKSVRSLCEFFKFSEDNVALQYLGYASDGRVVCDRLDLNV